MFGDKDARSCQLTLKWFRKTPIHMEDVYREKENDKVDIWDSFKDQEVLQVAIF